MADRQMLKVAPPPTEAEKIERIERVVVERMNAQLAEMAPTMRAQILGELKSDMDTMKRESRRLGRNEGRWQGMILGAILVLGLMAFGYTAVTFNTAVAVRQGAAIAGAEAANNEIRQELDR